MGNIIRTANGVPIDMDRLRLENEHVIAVGNMNVNARGDEIKNDKVTKTRADRLKEHHKLHSTDSLKKR